MHTSLRSFLLILLALTLAACSVPAAPTPTLTPQPTATSLPTVVPTATLAPTASPVPPTEKPTEKPKDTATPEPTATATPDLFTRVMRAQIGESWNAFYSCTSDSCSLKYVFTGELKFGVPVKLANGEVVGTAEFARVGTYLGDSGQRMEILVVGPDDIRLPDGNDLEGNALTKETIEEKRAWNGVNARGRVYTLGWVVDYDADYQWRKAQNPNAQPYSARAREFFDEYYASWQEEWERFKTTGDNGIGVVVGAFTGGTGKNVLLP